MLLRARILLPISQPPIEDGAIVIERGQIIWVGRWVEVPAGQRHDIIDSGEMIVMPGLINAHCHLDYTNMAGQIPAPKVFSDWIKAIVALKGGWGYTEFAQSWLHGAQMLVRTGTTTVLDVEAVPELIPDLWNATPLRVLSFRELINLRSRSEAGEIIETAAREWSSLPEAAGRIGLSPHAPYSTTTELLRAAARTATQRNWRLTTHVAESESEFEMFMHRRGPLYDWLQSQREMSDCGHGSPVQNLERCGYLSENLLAVHANYLWRDDASTLARRKVSIVHCPRSHAYFGHRSFPRAELAASGINICLGTDSLASTIKIRKEPPELNMFAEMQALAAGQPGLSPETILRMATIHGAIALGRRGQSGELSPGALADLIALPFNGKLENAEEAAAHHRGDVAASMIHGNWVKLPGGLVENHC